MFAPPAPDRLPPEWLVAALEHVTDYLALIQLDGTLCWASPSLRGLGSRRSDGVESLTAVARRLVRALREKEDSGDLPEMGELDGSAAWRFRLVPLHPDTARTDTFDARRSTPEAERPELSVEPQVSVALAVIRPVTEALEASPKTIARRAPDLAQANRELEALNEVALAVNQTLELSAVLGIALEKALGAAEIEIGWVRLLAEDGSEELEMVAHRGLSPACAAAVARVPLRDSFPGKVVLTGKPIVLYTLPQDCPACRHFATHEGLRCVADIPLSSRRRVVGVLGIGSRRILQITERLVHFLTAIGNQVGIAIENARLYEQVQRRSWLDPLTQIYNRQRFHELLEAAMGQRSSHVPRVLLLDVDRLKELNDTFGHVYGDRALRRVAEHLREHAAPEDIVGRYGGDEFVLGLLDPCYASDPSAVEQLIHRLRRPLEIPHPDAPITVTVSIGLAADGSSVEDLLHRADQAMYAEKRPRR